MEVGRYIKAFIYLPRYKPPSLPTRLGCHSGCLFLSIFVLKRLRHLAHIAGPE